jgi:PPOX class probable FMN-dependent enzyme
MTGPDTNYDIVSMADLEQLFDAPKEASLVKELDHLDANYRALVGASPFLVLASAGACALDCSPRGDPPGFVEVLDEKTLIIPDRRGNSRIDTLRNLMVDPRVALLFLVPGLGETLRVNGRARINRDPDTLSRFTVHGRTPKLVIVVTVEAAYFQCSRAIVRSELWNAEKHAPRSALPTAGKILGELSNGRIDGEAYDRELPGRVKSTLY